MAPLAQRRLAELTGAARSTLARDSFAYLHLPMIAGIELFALGVEQVVGHVDEALVLEASTALFGGIALYLLAHVAFKLRNGRRPEPRAARRRGRRRRLRAARDGAELGRRAGGGVRGRSPR